MEPGRRAAKLTRPLANPRPTSDDVHGQAGVPTGCGAGEVGQRLAVQRLFFVQFSEVSDFVGSRHPIGRRGDGLNLEYCSCVRFRLGLAGQRLGVAFSANDVLQTTGSRPGVRPATRLCRDMSSCPAVVPDGAPVS